MNFDGEASADEYFVTASQIFDYCGADSTSTMRVDVLMDKFAPFVQNNRAEFETKIAELKLLLDPNQCNPEISVRKLAMTLNKYSESQKIKVDLEESFNLKVEQAPHDSDSGISTDGFQVLEDLQCELREKSHLAHQLRSQLDFTDRQHEEALAALSAERDSLRAHLNMLREENMTLTHVRRDYEEVCERLCGCERALEDSRRDLDLANRRARALHNELLQLEAEKSTLQEQLSRSKEECHHINEMYASRQTALRQENEGFRAEHADLASRLHDQEEFMQQLIKEKVLLEMELKDMLNKSNQTHLRLAERSIDVSYSEDQILTELDSLNADSRFVQERHLLDEESFVNGLRDDQGRSTNISLFHELRHSFCNMSRNNFPEQMLPEKLNENLDTSFSTVGTQTDANNIELNDAGDKGEIEIPSYRTASVVTQTDANSETEFNKVSNKVEGLLNRMVASVVTQTDGINEIELSDASNKVKGLSNRTVASIETQTDANDVIETYGNLDDEFINIIANKSIGIQYDYSNSVDICTQTDLKEKVYVNNNNETNCIDCSKCIECERLKVVASSFEHDLTNSRETITNMQLELDMYEDNLGVLDRLINDGKNRNKFVEESMEELKLKVDALETVCKKQVDRMQEMFCKTESVLVQTEYEQSSVSTQAELPCTDCVVRKTTSRRSLKKYLWEPLKWLFQLFAVVCFACAVCALYAVTSRARTSCRDAPAVPWRWLHAQDLVDLLLRIEYVADVPM